VDSQKYATITGPSHAEEVAKKKPTVTVVTSRNTELSSLIQDIFSSNYFRVYSSKDVIGCELGGAVKNVIALASGILSGFEMGDNANAALLTRGLAEIIRLGEKIGGKSLTFAGISGLGDLFVTCSSQYSRNRRAGNLISQGLTIEEIKDEYNFVAEGIYTAKSTLELANKNNIEMPIVEQVNEILFNKKDPRKAIQDLMIRDFTTEFFN
jgi:glycerol-3-phosphate dehydrogenase (NAD(P)+)